MIHGNQKRLNIPDQVIWQMNTNKNERTNMLDSKIAVLKNGTDYPKMEYYARRALNICIKIAAKWHVMGINQITDKI